MQRILICLFALAALTFSAEARERRAFVVGVDAYAELPKLDTTANDAKGFQKTFNDELKFDSVIVSNGRSLAEFQIAFGAFLDSIKPGDDIVFVFSGHGWSDGAENYLALGDARKDTTETVLKMTTVSLSGGVLDLIHARKPGALIVIIDACRSNPFALATKTLTKGLARVTEREGTLIAFAAGAGQEALARLPGEQGQQLSLFSRYLLPRLKDPNRPLARIFEDTRMEVQRIAAAIPHAQRPAVYSEMPLDFCLSRNCTAAFDEEELLWLEISTSLDYWSVCSGYQIYLNQYPSGKFATWAKSLLDSGACLQVDLLSSEPWDFENCPDLKSTIHFEFDRTSLSAANVARLQELIHKVSVCPAQRIDISGYDDIDYLSDNGEPISAAYSISVSERRAQTVSGFLVANGVDASVIRTEARGGTQPLSQEGSNMLNARVEISVKRNLTELKFLDR